MITIEEMQAMLDDIASEFPTEFFEELNGGIILLPEARHHEQDIDGELYTLGQYHSGGGLGRYITIYFGSFMRVYGYLGADKIKEKLRNTVRHEFRHHIESLAGNDDLERIDRQYIADYKSGEDYEADEDEDYDENDGDYDDDEFDDEDFDEFDDEDDGIDGDDEDDGDYPDV